MGTSRENDEKTNTTGQLRVPHHHSLAVDITGSDVVVCRARIDFRYQRGGGTEIKCIFYLSGRRGRMQRLDTGGTDTAMCGPRGQVLDPALYVFECLTLFSFHTAASCIGNICINTDNGHSLS